MHAPSRTDRPAVPVGRWILRTFVGWTLGFVLAIACIVAVDAVGISGTQSPLAIGMGLGVGLLQSRLVGPRVGGARPWILATAGGLALPFLIADIGRVVGAAIPYSLAAYVASGGGLAGLLQWRLLRESTPAGAWWLALTPIGWILAGSTVWVNEWLPRLAGPAGAGRYVGVVLSGGLVLGLAGALAWRLIDASADQPLKRR